MALLPNSQDEPAVQDALVAALVKMVIGVAAASGLALTDNVTAVITALAGAVVAAAIGYVQGKVTREKVVPVATALQLAPDVGWPDVQLPAELTVTDAPLTE